MLRAAAAAAALQPDAQIFPQRRLAAEPPPIRRKKSSAFSTGTPESSFFDSLGASLPKATGASLRRLVCCAFACLALTKGEPLQPARLGAVPPHRLYSARLEKRSQALQACNLTRNIQADGAPLVHLTPEGSDLQGSFLSPADTRVMPWKTHRDSPSRRLLSSRVRSLLWHDRFLFGLLGNPCRPATYRGLSKEVHED
jgi:hypothetical protein